MEKAKILEQMIKDTGMSLKAFAAKCNIPYTTLYTILKNGVGRASVDNIIIICRNLGIKVEELDTIAKGSPAVQLEPTYEDMEQLIARNGKKLSHQEKFRLIQLLSELDQ